MLYLKTFLLFFKVLFNLHKYKYFLEKPEGTGRKWTLYKRPIFVKSRNEKNVPETKAHHFIYHAFESLEAKSPQNFKKEMLDNIILAVLWYNTVKIEEENEDKNKDPSGEKSSL